MKNNEVTNVSSHKLKIALGVGALVIVLAAFGIGAIFANAKTLKKFPQQFFIADIDVSGKTPVEARALLVERATQIEHLGLQVNIGTHGTHMLPLAVDGKKIFEIDIDGTMSNAQLDAGNLAFVHHVKDWIGLSSATHINEVVTSFSDSSNLAGTVITSWNLGLSGPVDARFEMNGGSIRVVPGALGEAIKSDELIQIAERALAHNDSTIQAAVETTEPQITTTVAESLVPKAQSVAAAITAGRTLTIDGATIPVSSATLLALVQPRIVNGEAIVQFDEAGLVQAVGTVLMPYQHPASNGAFERTGNRATKFVPSQKGIAIDWQSTADNLYTSLSTASTTVAVATKETQPGIPLSEVNDLGINEVLGVGSSDFKNSPPNRIHNITVGMNSVNGILIAPGETFSLMKTLGKIDGTTGYLQELVIKDNKTMPEFGGGLCQIGTTTFRAAMGAGFPIVERQNHSYQVSYYFENGLSGTDATIYDPKPDFRFLNDTGHWAMIQAEKKGTKLFFTVWGTRDGRVADRTVPKVLARQPAPPSKIIETTDLPVGKVKCTEHAHPGATTLFSYTISYPNGTVNKQDFKSYYKPWGEVCLHGVAPGTIPADPLPAGVPALPTADATGVTGNTVN